MLMVIGRMKGKFTNGTQKVENRFTQPTYEIGPTSVSSHGGQFAQSTLVIRL